MFFNHSFSLIFSSYYKHNVAYAKDCDYLKILADKEVGNFVVIHFDECFRSTREALYSKLGEEKK